MPIHIILCTDEYYVMPCGITIFSICYHNRHHQIMFHVLTEGVDENKKDELRRITKDAGQEIRFYDVDSSLIGNVPVDNRFRISIYYRLLMAKILPKDIDKILYLDSDIIVRGDIEELWNKDISDVELAAVLDQSCDDIRIYNRTGLSPLSGYYNSGVLLINLRYWREHNTGERCIAYVNKNSKSVQYPDQDALNFITHKAWKVLPFRYNTQAFMYYRRNEILARTEYVNEMIEASMNPLVMHFTEARKPWMTGCTHPFKEEYLKYKKLSPWAEVPLTVKISTGKTDQILASIKNLCIKMGVAKSTPVYSCYRDFSQAVISPYRCP